MLPELETSVTVCQSFLEGGMGLRFRAQALEPGCQSLNPVSTTQQLSQKLEQGTSPF